MSKTKPTRCGKCGGTSKPFTMFANASTGESHYLCANCMASGSAEQADDLAEIDELITEYEEMVERLEEIVKDSEEPEMPPGLEAFAFTPMKSYKMAQMSLAALKSKRLELLSQGGNEERLRYELNKKIGEEKYEEASAIQKRLDELKAVPKEKGKPGKKKAEKKPSQLFAAGEDAEGKCTRCKERFPKPPGLFYDFDIGNCHEMCLSCCVHEVPKYVTTVKMADEMLAEMEKFSGMMGTMAIMGKLMSGDYEELEGEDEESLLRRLKGEEKAKARTAGQEASEMMIKVLKMRRDFLARTNEDEEMVEAANLLTDLLKNVFGEDAIADLEGFPDDLSGKAKAPQKKQKPPKEAPKKGRKKRGK